MDTKKINYYQRDFAGVREELFNYIQQYYPDNVSDFNDASIGTMLVELLAAVGDQLAFNTDRMFQETQLDYAQERRNILAIAKNMGLNVPGKRPSLTIVDFSVTIPTFGDTFDATYLPVIKTGAQVQGGGKVFETLSDIDFSSSYNSLGVENIRIIPNIDNNQVIKNYTITKREIVTNGTTKIFKKSLSATDYKPFLEIILPDNDVISVEQVLNLDGTNYSTNPTLQQFLSNKNRFYEVPALVEDKIFVEDLGKVSDRSGVKSGKYITISKKFIKEYTESGLCKLSFGGGMANNDVFANFLQSINLNIPNISSLLNNDALGEIPKANSTIFIRYRVGGGAASNIGANILTGKGNIEIQVNGNRDDYNQSVKSSLTVNNPIPALGGNDEPSIDEIRKLTTYNFSSQNRCVTSRDYVTQIQKMDGKFGSPFRLSTHELENKIVIAILALDQNGKLSNQSTTTLKENIAEYISKYRLMNDYVEIKDGRILNLGFAADILMDKTFSQSDVVAGVVTTITDYFDITKHDMNENIYMSALIEAINNVAGVINVIDLRIFNKTGGDYGTNQISQEYVDATTQEIQLIDYTIFGEEDSMFQIFAPNKDISVRIKTT